MGRTRRLAMRPAPSKHLAICAAAASVLIVGGANALCAWTVGFGSDLGFDTHRDRPASACPTSSTQKNMLHRGFWGSAAARRAAVTQQRAAVERRAAGRREA
ncbi:unnamed protein product [Polarella glacialis]|uniref:Uncharacterized protein n=1 Tax=Polarella glacialis TaxID=89957 RepID=A0A813D7T0_POLGL|nr:unnamed protein product [Polarella glacialis]